MIPATVLEASRKSAEQRLDRTGRIVRSVRIEDDALGYDDETEPFPEEVALGIAPGQGGQQQLQQNMLERIANREYFVILLPTGTTITEQDTIEVDSVVPRTDEQVTDSYTVIGIPNRLITYETLIRVIAVRKDDEG